jgi:hypothetical protein
MDWEDKYRQWGFYKGSHCELWQLPEEDGAQVLKSYLDVEHGGAEVDESLRMWVKVPLNNEKNSLAKAEQWSRTWSWRH